MSDETTLPQAPDAPNFSPRFYSIALLVAAIVVSGIWLIGRFTSIDLARDMQTWQEKLNIIAENRADAVNGVISGHFKELHTLADNPSLQLYLTELQTMGSNQVKENEPAQKSYLRNLLLFTAERQGFTNSSNNVTAIGANVQQESKSGLAVINNKYEIVVSTAMAPATKDLMLEQVKKLAAGQDGFIDIQKHSTGELYMGFIVPVFSIQGDRNANSQMGNIVGLKTVGPANLFNLLKQPGSTENTLESMLVRSSGGKIEYISPLQDGTGALTKEIDIGPNRPVEVELINNPGIFINDKRDYRNRPILATSRPIAGTPWTLVVKIDSSEALSESTQRRSSMVIFFFLIIAIIVTIVIAVWWHAHSKRSMMMSYYFKKMAAQATAQEQLLRLVADNQPEPIYIVDRQHIYRFANQKTAQEMEMSSSAVVGKTLQDVRGAARAAQIGSQCEKALKIQSVIYDTQHIQERGVERIIRSAYIPLNEIPIINLPAGTPGVLVVEQDISEVVQEREKRINTHHQLVQTLLKLVDRRDPFAANHSLLVSQISYEVAVDMDLDSVLVDTTRFAGSLMNIGKIVIPTELLTKTESLTAEEKHIIRDSMNAAADLMKDINFDGPVAETLRQWQEKWDGSGPMGLRGESVLISARIIAVANAFVGMISPRSWRTAIPIESANKFLLEQCDTHFDRRVVVALINYVENHSGKAWLKQIIDSQKTAA